MCCELSTSDKLNMKMKLNNFMLTIVILPLLITLLHAGNSSKNKNKLKELQMSDGCFCKVNFCFLIITDMSPLFA